MKNPQRKLRVFCMKLAERTLDTTGIIGHTKFEQDSHVLKICRSKA